MSWNVQNYGTRGFAQFPLGTTISALMQAYRIDICALIEVSHNGQAAIRNDIHVNQDHLQLRRESSAPISGTTTYLELYQDALDGSAADTHPCIRFNHRNHFWHRLEASKDGLHVKTDDTNRHANYFAGWMQDHQNHWW